MAVVLLALALGSGARTAERGSSHVFEGSKGTAVTTPLDDLVVAAHRRHRVQMAPPCSDATFVRRAFLDVAE
jgi:hypothetical protein